MSIPTELRCHVVGTPPAFFQPTHNFNYKQCHFQWNVQDPYWATMSRSMCLTNQLQVFHRHLVWHSYSSHTLEANIRSRRAPSLAFFVHRPSPILETANSTACRIESDGRFDGITRTCLACRGLQDLLASLSGVQTARSLPFYLFDYVPLVRDLGLGLHLQCSKDSKGSCA